MWVCATLSTDRAPEALFLRLSGIDQEQRATKPNSSEGAHFLLSVSSNEEASC